MGKRGMWVRRESEQLFELPQTACGPFGEEPQAWWRRLSRKTESTPKRYTVPVGLVSGLVVLGSNAHGAAKLLILPFAAGLLVAAVDWWWRSRARRDQEQVLPSDRPDAHS
jgi:hypothetical protein